MQQTLSSRRGADYGPTTIFVSASHWSALTELEGESSRRSRHRRFPMPAHVGPQTFSGGRKRYFSLES